MTAASSRKIDIYDTTLRDGSQGEGISFSVEDKVKIAKRLDAFGVDYIEGGWPGSNPKDIEFFDRMKSIPLKHAKLAAFGSTRRPTTTAETDPMLQQLLDAQTPVITFVGKSWDFHVTEALRIPLETNLEMIADTTRYLKLKGKEVIYDAEHFFDGYKRNPEYTSKCVAAALDAGCDVVALCDTNGGTLPNEISKIVSEIGVRFPNGKFAIHTHNDAECGVANSLAAIEVGAIQVQGTINGLGERTGNANLTSIVPSLGLKLGYELSCQSRMKELSDLSNFIDEIANVPPKMSAAYVGRSAFAHKAGLHVDAMRKNSETYEHIDPTLVGNERRILVSEHSGASTILEKVQRDNSDLRKDSPETKEILKQVARLEHEGSSFEGAEASFELLVKKATGNYRSLFELTGYRVIVERRGGDQEAITEATVKLRVHGQEVLTVAEGDGPVNALDSALRKALTEHYPDLADIRLTDFKVRVVNAREGAAAKVRAIVDSADASDSWSTIGVSTNIIDASWHALVDSVEYGLLRGNEGSGG
ncbi:MAG: citramalate synthase [Capsulimonas sp.]|uniref:citramalate synthase n=1 Tax=Capsulimonas sp. TaxID=2494211 RepID=UPI003264F1F2